MGVTNQNDSGLKSYFTFANLPLTITVGLITMSWLSVLSVILFA
ncbi:hypothetical protein SAMN05192560_1843 [Methylobacillus rhizosphaerae]|uniref:Uncharacterized protein n=1 Tax=Methylobacillus rhizosphaerae TaxID=551994 RepID=A0A239AE20_9PROT|nr:hypothetical protein [Methylobacillus rhizosphaerae]SNR93622.1 hypothetical protein SAMN05192560_1843 [Methylobacillus rhizosphaerae]